MALLQNTSLTNKGVSVSDVEYDDLVHKLCKTVIIIIIKEDAKDTDDFIIFNRWDIVRIISTRALLCMNVSKYQNFPSK